MGSARAQVVDVNGRGVSVSNLTKVLYPSGFTKGQVIDFYIRASDYLLPHLRGRPVTLKRYPNGVKAGHFYEKNAPEFTPEWIRTFEIPRRSGESNIRYVLIDDLPSLVWSANLANLEMHPFLSCVPEIQRPTFVVFDLDPGEGADILDCAAIAFLLRDQLKTMGLECYAKVSGSKGIQVYVPLNTAASYEQTRPFARAVAEFLERAHPDEVVSKMAKPARKAKVFIDWSQNADFKTTVCVYSLRAKADRPYVSIPVTWEELRSATRRRKAAALYFDPEAALQRLEAKGDLFAPVLRAKQKLPRQAGSRSAAGR